MEIKLNDYGQERERIATESELEIYEIIKEITGRDDLRLVRKSNDYVSALLGEWDLARFKYTPRAKWIVFPVIDLGSSKRRISAPEDVREFEEDLNDSIAHILKYSND